MGNWVNHHLMCNNQVVNKHLGSWSVSSNEEKANCSFMCEISFNKEHNRLIMRRDLSLLGLGIYKAIYQVLYMLLQLNAYNTF